VKAPDFEDDYADLINVTLTNSKGDEFIRTHTKAKSTSCRKSKKRQSLQHRSVLIAGMT